MKPEQKANYDMDLAFEAYRRGFESGSEIEREAILDLIKFCTDNGLENLIVDHIKKRGKKL
jgi:hypothetical protein